MKGLKGKNKITRKSRRQQLIEKGEQFSKKENVICYAGVLTAVLFFGIILGLNKIAILIAMVLCVLQVPGLYYHYKKADYERKRFNDVNAYMAQMTQSFTGNGKILMSLKETRDTFPQGMMRQNMTKAIGYIEQSADVELAQQEALQLIAKQYECERIHTLHDFLCKAEERGGSCESEFRLLENIRQLWEKNVLKYRNTLLLARNLVTFEYLLLVLVCVFMLRQFPEDLKIIHLPLVQGVNTFLIVCFFLVFCKMDKKCSHDLLSDVRHMEEEAAFAKLSYVEEFDGKAAFIKQIPIALGVLSFFFVFYLAGGGLGTVAVGFGLSVLALYGRHLKYLYTVHAIKSEMKEVFPGWLFDVLLLMQSENVAVALAKSIEKSPSILKKDLRRLKKELEENPMSAEAFLSFLAEYHITEVENVMRKLYALNCGNGVGGEVMKLMIDINMTMLSEAEAQKLRFKGDICSLYYMLPTVPVMICMAGYGAALMAVIFQNVMTVI